MSNTGDWGVHIRDMTIQNGNILSGGLGGALYNQGTMTVTNVALTNNQTDGDGGAVFNTSNGRITLDSVEIQGNTADFGGGVANTGQATLNDVVVQSNSGSGGGGIGNTRFMTITESTLRDNSSSNSGGGILNYGVLLLTDSNLDGNQATGQGGGIYNDDFSSFVGDATIRNSEITTNSAGASGGGLANAGTMVVENSTINGNNSGSGGGGIYNSQLAVKIDLNGSTIANNQSGGLGGGLRNEKEANIRNSTFSGNQLTNPINGAGIFQGGAEANLSLIHVTISDNRSSATGTANGLVSVFGEMSVYNSLLVDNGSGGDNCAISETTVTQAGNLSDDGSCPGFNSDSSAVLLPLADNGGPTWTHALPDTSPARGAAGSAGCLQTDQRGVPRGVSCDVGAYEYGTLYQIFQSILRR